MSCTKPTTQREQGSLTDAAYRALPRLHEETELQPTHCEPSGCGCKVTNAGGCVTRFMQAEGHGRWHYFGCKGEKR